MNWLGPGTLAGMAALSGMAATESEMPVCIPDGFG